jgi:hypothetical protein
MRHGTIPAALRMPLVAALVAAIFVWARFATGNPLSSAGGDLVYVHHRARLQILAYWHDLLGGQISLLEFLQLADTEFPPFLHLATLALGAVFGHSAEVAIVSGLLWLLLLAAAVGYITQGLARPAQRALAPTTRCHREAGSLAASVVLLMGCYQGFTLRYYYDLPMTALLWAGVAVAMLLWERRPVLGGVLAGLVVTASALTKWTALPFAAAMAAGLVITSLGLPGGHGSRRSRLKSLAVATAVAALLCGSFLQVVDEGGKQSSLSIMGGTFQAESGRVLTSSDLRAGLHDLLAEQAAAFELQWTSPQMGSSAQLRSYDWDADGVTDLVAIDHNGGGRVYNQQTSWGSSAPRLKLAHRWRPPPMRPVGPPFGDWTGSGTLQPTRRSDPILKRHLNQGIQQPDPTGEEIAGRSYLPPLYAWGDFDGDGDLDLAVAIRGDSLAVLRNVGGTLSGPPAWRKDGPEEVTGLSWGDWDGDGDLDLAVAVINGPNLVYDNEDGDLQLGWKSRETDHSECVAWGDWDGDGDLDLAVGNSFNEPNRLYDNNSGRLSLSWTSAEAEDTVDLAWGDWDGDGDQDLAVANLDAPNRVYESIGGGPSLLWTSPAIDPTRTIGWHDWDADGRLDLVIGNEGRNPDRVYRNVGLDAGTAAAGGTASTGPDSLGKPEPSGASAVSKRNAARQRLMFYPRRLLHSVFSLPLFAALALLTLLWAVRSRSGMALLLCTAFGQVGFLLAAVPPLDERFVITLAPALVVAAALGWGTLPAALRGKSAVALLILATLIAVDFHFLEAGEGGAAEEGPSLWTHEGLSLHTSSYPDGGWKRGEDERLLVRRGAVLGWRDARRFQDGLWDAVQRCAASTVAIGSAESPVDDTDWWQYKLALESGRAATPRDQRPLVHVIEGVDVAAGNYLAAALGPSGLPDLAFSVHLEGHPGGPPAGIAAGTMVLDHILPARGEAPAVSVWRALDAAACAQK